VRTHGNALSNSRNDARYAAALGARHAFFFEYRLPL